jgi:dephospho-CoA kinase
VLKTFGDWIIDEEGQIDRTRLAKLVFADPHASEKLEAIVHPREPRRRLWSSAPARPSSSSRPSAPESDLSAGCDTVGGRAPEDQQIA